MMYGEFRDTNEIVVTLEVQNRAEQSETVDAVIDTGFSGYLMLPRSLVVSLGLPQVSEVIATLADGGLRQFSVHEAVVLWNGRPRTVPAYASEGASLVGISLLRGHLLTLELVRDGSITIEPAA